MIDEREQARRELAARLRASVKRRKPKPKTGRKRTVPRVETTHPSDRTR